MKKSHWSLQRWLYHKGIWIEHRFRQLDEWYSSLFVEQAQLKHYLPQLLELRRLLEGLLLEEVLLTYKRKGRAAMLSTRYDMIVRVTIFPQGVGIHKKTSIVFRYNPKYQDYQIWFSAAFLGLRLRFVELPLELTVGMEVPRRP